MNSSFEALKMKTWLQFLSFGANSINFTTSWVWLFPEIEDAAQKWQSSFERTLGRFSFLWLAEKDDEIVAFILARVKQSPAYLGSVQIGEISDLFVADKFRGNEIGEKLVELAMQKFRELEMQSVEVQIQAGNDRGLDFWRQLDFDMDLSQVRKVLKDDLQ